MNIMQQKSKLFHLQKRDKRGSNLFKNNQKKSKDFNTSLFFEVKKKHDKSQRNLT